MEEIKTSKSVFISYSHDDKKWLDELQKYLYPWIREQKLNVWVDTHLEPGSNWRTEIEMALNSAKVAILLVTQNFLSSKFIMDIELPLLVERANNGEIRLIWIAIEHSSYKKTSLNEFTAANNPENPLSTLKKPQRDRALVQIANSIGESYTIGTLAKSLKFMDETIESIEAYIEKRPERPARNFAVQATYNAKNDEISFSGSKEVISYIDLRKLPIEDQEYISAYEETLEGNYMSWKKIRKGLGDAGGILDDEIESQLNRVIKLICDDLNNILDFIGKMHKCELDDHYGRYRHICSMLRAQ